MSGKPYNLLFTRGLAHVHTALLDIRADMQPDEFRLHACYAQEPMPLRLSADRVHYEPPADEITTYTDWLFSLCAAESIGFAWPQRQLRFFYRQRQRLEAAGLRLLLPAASLDDLEDLDNKDRFYARLRWEAPEIPLPACLVARTPAEFSQALDELATLVPGVRVCLKPARGIFGRGFRILDETSTLFRRLLDNDCLHLTRREMEAVLEENHQGLGFLVMEYLPGIERSLDCLADQGELKACIVRRKGATRWQKVENHPESLRVARRLCQLFGLHGVVNIQTRERLTSEGPQACVLEINPRMAGGVGIGRVVGCNLALWGARLAVGMSLDGMPAPTTDVWAGQIEQAVGLGPAWDLDQRRTE